MNKLFFYFTNKYNFLDFKIKNRKKLFYRMNIYIYFLYNEFKFFI